MSRGLTITRGCPRRSNLATPRVTSDLAVMPDGVKYVSVAVDEHAHGNQVIPQEADDRKRLRDILQRTSLYVRLLSYIEYNCCQPYLHRVG